MEDALTKIPRLIISGRILTGQSPASKEDNLRALARFSEYEEIKNFLKEAEANGYGGLLSLSEANIAAALREIRKDRKNFQVLPIIPNVPSYVRDATEYGMAGAGLRRLARVGVGGAARAALAGITNPFGVLRKDFATLMSILYALEMGELGRFRPPAVFLHTQMTDIALSFGNRDFFLKYAYLMRRRYHTEPGLVTANFVKLAGKLMEWDIPISLIIAPLNREGYLMPGGLNAYQRILEGERFHLIADRVSIDAPTPHEAVDWALAHKGVIGAVVERI